MVKHNNVVPNAHFKKHWQERIRVTLDQPARKKRRRLARKAKAAAIAPRPAAGLFRPVVRCPTQKYNMKLRQGRGFTLEELKAAGINRKDALNIGIAVDTPAGLVVPVIRNVDQKSIEDLSLELVEISEKARSKKLKPDDMIGGTFTISSLGGIGGTYFTPIICSFPNSLISSIKMKGSR